MNPLIREVKTRARLLVNAVEQAQPKVLAQAQRVCETQRWPWPERLQIKHGLNIVSAQIGFEHWEHARRVLGAEAVPGDDMGTFWYTQECSVLLNHWYADHRHACDQLAADPQSFLLPYRRQFVVVRRPWLEVIGAADEGLWSEAGRDAVRSAGSASWVRLAELRLAASRPA